MSKMKNLKNSYSNLLSVHYSCENLNDQNEGLSPRITSIAVQHLESKSIHSYSVHLIAERHHIIRTEIDQHYNTLEQGMLQEFAEYVRSHSSNIWLHWNMGTVHYGFDAIAHRYAVLSGNTFPEIPDINKIDLSDLIKAKYGNEYVDHPRMRKLMEMNGGIHPDFLSGEDEVTAFQNHEFVRMHKSTLCKVMWFKKVFDLLATGKLKTQRSDWATKCNRVVEHPIVKICGLIALVFALARGVSWIYKFF